MKRLLLLFIVFYISTINYSNAQTTFSTVYSHATLGYKAHAFCISPDSGYVIAGKHENFNSRGLIIKVDSIGDTIWCKRYGSTTTEFYHIIPTLDSSYAIIGNSLNTSTNKQDIVCLKINQQGDTIWSTAIEEVDNAYGYKIEQTFDKGFIICGYTESTNPFQKAVIIKLNANGSLQWNKVIHTSNSQNIASSIKQAPDSTYIALIQAESTSPYTSFGHLVNIDGIGNIIWSKKYSLNASGSFAHTNVVDFQIKDSTIYVVVAASGNNGNTIFKTDMSGNVNWAKTYQSFVNLCNNCLKSKFTKLKNGGFAFTTGIGLSSTGAEAFYLDSALTIKQYGFVRMEALQIIDTYDNGFAIIGNGPLYGIKLPSNNPQIGLVKTDLQFNNKDFCISPMLGNQNNDSIIAVNSTFTSVNGLTAYSYKPLINTFTPNIYIGCVDFLGSVNDVQNNISISLFPNPFSNETTITLNKSIKNGIMKVTDLLGKEIYLESINGNEFKFQKNNLHNGMYLIQIISDNEIQASKRMIIE